MKSKKEILYKWVFAMLAFSSLFFLVGITVVLFQQGLPIFFKVGFFDFIFGRSWYPTYEPPDFGILPIILASLWVTIGSLIVSVPLGIGSAMYINELGGNTQRAILKPVIEILAGIPSIVFGFFGMVVVAPFIQDFFHLSTGLNVFTASFILGIMAIPTVCSLTEDALSFVPKSYREASYALGGNRWQTLTKVIVPAAGSGISTAIILGMSRIVGETMTVLMVSGGSAMIPKSIFDPVRPMTSTIAAEMGEAAAGSAHYHALFAIGLILFVITFIINIAAELISRNYRLKLGLSQ